MSETLIIASALVLILEGLLPFIAPKTYREVVTKMAALPDRSLRTTGLVLMMLGLILLYAYR